jgi:hypothetical protein
MRRGEQSWGRRRACDQAVDGAYADDAGATRAAQDFIKFAMLWYFTESAVLRGRWIKTGCSGTPTASW